MKATKTKDDFLNMSPTTTFQRAAKPSAGIKMVSAHCRLRVLHPAHQWPKTHGTALTSTQNTKEPSSCTLTLTTHSCPNTHIQKQQTLLKSRRLILHTAGKSCRGAHGATGGEWDSRVKPKVGKSILNNRKSLQVLYSIQT